MDNNNIHFSKPSSNSNETYWSKFIIHKVRKKGKLCNLKQG